MLKTIRKHWVISIILGAIGVDVAYNAVNKAMIKNVTPAQLPPA